MNKSMYSLMLSDTVVAAIDKLAYEAGVSRSGMINGILAEYVSYRTPEVRVREMLGKLETLLTGELQVMLRQSGTALDLRSALAFKYNPTVHYSVELYRAPGDSVGELKVSLRTQNSSLLLYMMQFYKLWARIEASYNPAAEYSTGDGKLARKIKLYGKKDVSEEEISRGVADYVRAFDAALKAFFYNLNDVAAAMTQVETIYRAYVRASATLI